MAGRKMEARVVRVKAIMKARMKRRTDLGTWAKRETSSTNVGEGVVTTRGPEVKRRTLLRYAVLPYPAVNFFHPIWGSSGQGNGETLKENGTVISAQKIISR